MRIFSIDEAKIE